MKEFQASGAYLICMLSEHWQFTLFRFDLRTQIFSCPHSTHCGAQPNAALQEQ